MNLILVAADTINNLNWLSFSNNKQRVFLNSDEGVAFRRSKAIAHEMINAPTRRRCIFHRAEKGGQTLDYCKQCKVNVCGGCFLKFHTVRAILYDAKVIQNISNRLDEAENSNGSDAEIDNE